MYAEHVLFRVVSNVAKCTGTASTVQPEAMACQNLLRCLKQSMYGTILTNSAIDISGWRRVAYLPDQAVRVLVAQLLHDRVDRRPNFLQPAHRDWSAAYPLLYIRTNQPLRQFHGRQA